MKSRASALDDEGMRAKILERARAILSLLDPNWVNIRREKDIEFLQAGLSETERRFESTQADLAAHQALLETRDRELHDHRVAIQQWKDYAARIERDLRQARADSETLKGNQGSIDEERRRVEAERRRLASRVGDLLEALDPIFDKAEYIAMDDEWFRERYEAAVEARDKVRRALEAADEDEAPPWG